MSPAAQRGRAKIRPGQLRTAEVRPDQICEVEVDGRGAVVGQVRTGQVRVRNPARIAGNDRVQTPGRRSRSRANYCLPKDGSRVPRFP